MDSIDLKILRHLSRNARVSASDIASKVKLSTSAVLFHLFDAFNNGRG